MKAFSANKGALALAGLIRLASVVLGPHQVLHFVAGTRWERTLQVVK